MLKAIIVDDEPMARDELAYILRRSKGVEVIGEAENMEEALREIQNLTPDVVFLDIELAEDSGLTLARRIRELEHHPEIVFATAFDEFALKAFELDAIDYLLKPFDEERIQQTVQKIIRMHDLRESRPSHHQVQKAAQIERTAKLAVTVEDRIILVNVSKILHISSVEGKTVIVTDERKYKVNEPLVTIEQKLHTTSIIRVHRAFLVNLDAIIEMQPWFHSTYTLVMKDGSKVPVSRTYLKELKQFIGL